MVLFFDIGNAGSDCPYTENLTRFQLDINTMFQKTALAGVFQVYCLENGADIHESDATFTRESQAELSVKQWDVSVCDGQSVYRETALPTFHFIVVKR